MKANDLMIGDWIEWQYPADTSYHGKYRVVAIEETWVDFLDERNYHCSQPYNEIFPIPLTAEILEKNGFKKDVRNENYYKWNWYILEDNASYDMETGMVRIFKASDLTFRHPIGYVHELQHALRLCGIEKEIVL